MKKYKKHMLAFLIPFSILSIIFILKGVLYNNDLIVVSDLKSQGIMFYDILKKILLNTESLTYNYSLGMGTAMFSTILFYCTSPLNIILLFFNDIVDAYLLIYIIKLSLAGLTMYLLLKYKFKKDNLVTILFSTCYALCSFAINYFYLPFWLDGLYLAPLTILGIEKILDKEKFSPLYIFSLALTIICNIQIGFGLCIFSLIYFIYSLFVRYNKNDIKVIRKVSLIFIISSILSALIASGTIIGMLNSFNNMYGSRAEMFNNTSYINLLFTNLFTVGHNTTEYINQNEPYIYCGLIITILSILYFFNNKIYKKKKIGAFFVILFFIISFFIKPLNIFWHLSNPNLINFRYTFYLSIFLTLIGFECYIKKVKYNKNILLSITAITILTVIINSDNSYAIPSIIAILIYLVILLLYNKNKKLEKILILTIVCELFCNTYLSIYTKEELEDYNYATINGMKEIEERQEFDLSYRILSQYSFTGTNKSFLDFKNSSLNYYSSIMNNKLKNYLSNLDFSTSNYYYESGYASPFVLSFLGNKYFYFFDKFDNDIYELKDSFIIDYYNFNIKEMQKQEIYYYENPYSLSLGFMIDHDVKLDENDNIVTYQNKIINGFTGNYKNVFTDLSKSIVNNSNDCPPHSMNQNCIQFNIERANSNIYIYNGKYDIFTNNNSKIYFELGNSLIYSIRSEDNFFKMAILVYKDDEDISYSLYTYDDQLLKDNLKQLQENMLYDVNIDKNILTGKIDAKKDGILFLSIPYDNKFEITVDGEKVDYFGLLDDNFIGLDLKQGSHEIKLVYKDNLPLICLLSSTVSLIISLFVIKYGNKYIEKKN